MHRLRCTTQEAENGKIKKQTIFKSLKCSHPCAKLIPVFLHKLQMLVHLLLALAPQTNDEKLLCFIAQDTQFLSHDLISPQIFSRERTQITTKKKDMNEEKDIGPNLHENPQGVS